MVENDENKQKNDDSVKFNPLNESNSNNVSSTLLETSVKSKPGHPHTRKKNQQRDQQSKNYLKKVFGEGIRVIN